MRQEYKQLLVKVAVPLHVRASKRAASFGLTLAKWAILLMVEDLKQMELDRLPRQSRPARGHNGSGKKPTAFQKDGTEWFPREKKAGDPKPPGPPDQELRATD